MPQSIDIFQSKQQFRQAFEAGLLGLLEEPHLGTFILVCANATYDRAIYDISRTRLQTLYEAFAARYHRKLLEGHSIDEVEEDLLVFLKMHAIGFEALQSTQRKHVGPWELQFNHLRAFRPRRISQHNDEAIRAAFNPHGFHFNKPFLQKEAFWEGRLTGRPVSLYYNKYPFADLHALLVPEREQCHQQYLTPHHHRYMWELCTALGETLDGVGFGYNAYGAFASVNHLHFQMFVREQGLPVSDALWQHNGGQRPYPTACHAFDAAEEAWAAIDSLHRQAISYNLLYTPERLYLFPRKKQGACETPPWSSGFTWNELAGGMVLFNQAAYESLDEAALEEELRRLAL